jgi:hypothetical protein
MEVLISPEEVLNRLRTHLEKANAECTGTILNSYAILRVHDDQQHYWSPQLTVELEEHEKGTLIRGLVGPRPAVWTLFASFYAFAIFGGLVGLIWGLSQWSLGITPFALWIVPVALFLVIIAYSIAYTGQKLGYEQMLLLRSFLDSSLEKK